MHGLIQMMTMISVVLSIATRLLGCLVGEQLRCCAAEVVLGSKERTMTICLRRAILYRVVKGLAEGALYRGVESQVGISSLK